MNGIELFKETLEGIRNTDFRDDIRYIYIYECPHYIEESPSSTTGKYHPIDEINKEGMLIHIKRCLVVKDELLRMWGFDKDSKEDDILTGACLLHDMYKFGLENSKQTVSEHPILIFDAIWSYIETAKNKEYLEACSYACLLHSGIWSPKEAYEKLQKTHKSYICPDGKHDVIPLAREYGNKMHLIDYVASRRNISDIMQYWSLNDGFLNNIINRVKYVFGN